MVTRPTSFCDIILATQKRTVLAIKKVDITIPAFATADGKAIRRTYDVSAEGEKILNGMLAKMERAFLAAPKDLMDLHDKVMAEAEDLGQMTAKK